MQRLLGLIPLAACIVYAFLARRYALARDAAHDSIPRASWLWSIPTPLSLAFLSVWGFLGLIDGGFTAVVCTVSVAIIAAAGLVSLRRQELWQRYEALPSKRRTIARIGLVAGILVGALLVIEVPFNSYMPFGGPSFFWLEMLIAGLLMLACYFLGQRHASCCVIPLLALFFIGIAQGFIKRFKNAGILPTDLFALGTAAAVSNEYVFSLNDQALLGIAFATCTIALLSLVRPATTRKEATPRHVLTNLGCALGATLLLAAVVLVPNYESLRDEQRVYWYSIDYYLSQGFLPTFIAIAQDMPIKRPEGYSDDEARNAMRQHADSYRAYAQADEDHLQAAKQFQELKPSIIAVMNESFADLSVYDGMHAGYPGPQFLKTGFDDALARGTLNVMVHGGGTCNSEFEFLTGNSLAFIGTGKYPYSVYDLSNIDALAMHLSTLGYHTCAIHPNFPSNWNRDKVYPQFGFDEFLSIEDFGGLPNVAEDTQTPNEPHYEVFHSGVSDAGTYEMMLKMLEEHDEPLFFFDVTMANHGSYDQNNIPADYQQHYHVADYEGETTDESLNEYLACIERSDDDLRDLIARLKNLKRPVVLVFFGDHQPAITSEFNDYWYTDEPADVHARRAFSSDYVIWANYDVAGQAQAGVRDETSVDMLAAKTLDLIGAPVTDYQAALLDIQKSIRSLSASDYLGADGTWHAPSEDSPYARDYHDLSLIEYLNFATRI